MSITKKSAVITDRKRYVNQIHGLPKGGKTTLINAICGGKIVFCDFEDGLKHLSVYSEPIRSWEAFRDTCSRITELKDPPFDYVGFDGTTTMVRYAMEYVCERASGKVKIEHPSDMAMGKGYELLKNEVMKPITKIATNPNLGLWLIGHTKVVTKRSASGDKEYAESTIIKSVSALIDQFVDLTVYLDFDTDNRRVLWCRSSSWHSAGGRIVLPEKLPLTFSENKGKTNAPFLNCRQGAKLFNEEYDKAIKILGQGGDISL